METTKALRMSVPYGVVIGGLGEYADEYLLPIFVTSGYRVWITRGAATLSDTLNRQIDLALVSIPDQSYLDQIPELLKRCQGVFMLIGPRHDQLVVDAFAYGVDDYIARPFRTDELIARVRAQLRRRQRYLPLPFTAGPFTFDLAVRTISFRDQPLDLDLPAFALLTVLAEAPTRRFTSTELLTLVWGRGQANNVSLLESTWQRVRQQIEGDESVLVGDITREVALLQ
ncbi:winged helix-turn-helix domain-containing protein [Chloroflexus sp.]|uniref:winged helix-turn-helix domain-containing protein n=2 Tax=Chloroflexus sp. TaxID=1904827 RepID=UPI004048F81C